MTAALSVPFAPLALAFMACGATMAFINVHLMPDMADHGVTSTAMSSAMILIGSTEIIGAFIAGLLCDRGFVRGILLAAYLLRGSAVLLLAVGPNDVVVHFFGVVFGSSYLMTVVATTVWIVESYPARVRGLLLGVLWAVHQVGAALSSQVGAVLHDHVGGYEPILYMGSVSCAISLAIVACLRSPKKRAKSAGPSDLSVLDTTD
ncbi:MFS transporter [Rathayibacter rathayi]